jgi:SpoVK/Ycf46/Vps4 family AAA+-type ATPase
MTRNNFAGKDPNNSKIINSSKIYDLSNRKKNNNNNNNNNKRQTTKTTKKTKPTKSTKSARPTRNSQQKKPEANQQTNNDNVIFDIIEYYPTDNKNFSKPPTNKFPDLFNFSEMNMRPPNGKNRTPEMNILKLLLEGPQSGMSGMSGGNTKRKKTVTKNREKEDEFKIDANKNYEIIEKKIETIDDLIQLGKEYDPKTAGNFSVDLKRLHKLIKPLTKLKGVIGMEKVKKSIVGHIKYFLQGFGKNDDMLHTVIQGPPGVGKTMLGRILGEIYYNMGIIKGSGQKVIDPVTGEEKDYVFEIVKRTDLIGKYLGHTGPKTEEMIKKCKGGVMFIDEVYALGNSEGKDTYSKECIDILNQHLSENKDLLVIIAGYEEDIEKCFFSYNKGLKRRFSFVYTIDKYDARKLVQIFMKKVEDKKWNIDKGIFIELEKFIEDNINKFQYFGGDMETLFLKCKMSHSKRVFGKHPKERGFLNMDDIKIGFNEFMKNRYKRDHNKEDDGDYENSIDTELKTIDDLINLGKTYDPEGDNKYNLSIKRLNRLIRPLEKLQKLISMNNVKKSVVDHIKYLLHLKTTDDDIPHIILNGKNGVGKTCLGKILGEIYYTMKIINGNNKVIDIKTGKEEDFIFEVINPSDLISKSAAQTKQIITHLKTRCKGGVLFVNNFESLLENEEKGFYFQEFMTVFNDLLKENKFLCIFAGEDKNIKKYVFDKNKELQTKFLFKYDINTYNVNEVIEIFNQQVDSKKCSLDQTDTEKFNKFIKKNIRKFSQYGSDTQKLFIYSKLHNLRRVFGKNPKEIGVINMEDIEKGYDDFVENKKKINPSTDHLYQ